MVWFKVDDRFHHHPKAIAAGTAAIGLWTIAGSWSVDNLTDGFIPDHVLATLSPSPHLRRAAKRLVEVGLWEEVPGGGWQFHDWGDDGRQKTSAQVKAERKATRERQARFRENHRNAVTNASVTPGVTRESQDPHLTSPIYRADAVTDPVRGTPQRQDQKASLNGQTTPAARHPSARTPAEAAFAAGIIPNGRPLDDETVATIAAKARQALNGGTP